MYSFLLNEKQGKYDIYKSNQEIIEFIFHTLSLSQNALSIEEWLFVIKEIQIYAENLQFPKKYEFTINSILEIIFNNYNKIKQNKRILIELKEIQLFLGRTKYSSETIIEFCLNSIKNDCIIDFIEPLTLSAPQYQIWYIVILQHLTTCLFILMIIEYIIFKDTKQVNE